jgi:hypothetical protein
MRYNQIKQMTTMTQHNGPKSPTQPKIHKTIQPPHTHHKTQALKTNTQNKPFHTYIKNYNLTITTKNPTPTTHKIKTKKEISKKISKKTFKQTMKHHITPSTTKKHYLNMETSKAILDLNTLSF